MFDIADFEYFDIDQHICRKMTTCHMSAWTLEHALGTGDSQLCNAVHTGWTQISRRKRTKKWDNSRSGKFHGENASYAALYHRFGLFGRFLFLP